MKGVEDSEAEPKVAARDMSLPLPLREEMCLKKKRAGKFTGNTLGAVAFLAVR